MTWGLEGQVSTRAFVGNWVGFNAGQSALPLCFIKYVAVPCPCTGTGYGRGGGRAGGSAGVDNDCAVCGE